MGDLRVKYGIKGTKKADILHSSGYAKEQSGDNVGAAGVASFAARSAVNEQRKYVREYRNARLLQGIRGLERAKTYVPRVEKASNAARGRGSLTQKSSDLSSVPENGASVVARAKMPMGPTIASCPPRRLPGVKF